MNKIIKSERATFDVFLDAAELGSRQKIGVLYRHPVRTDLPASFEYDPSWINSEQAFMIDPRLELWPGEQHPPTHRPAFGILMDSAPDRWGRVLLERREASVAARENRKMRSLQEMDFLLGVHDLTRVGALRFRSTSGGPFLDNTSDLAAPPVINLRELAQISQRLEEPGVEQLQQYEQWLAMLIAPGTSLGGARPKANFTEDNGRLWIAKFPARDDRYDLGAWEFLVHRLARRAGVWVPPSRIEKLTEQYRTFCVARFDRTEGDRRMYASAMTLLERQDGDDDASYLNLAEFISNRGAMNHIDEDLEQLFRRVVFNVFVGNRDDHLRNHGFIRTQTGWRLSPAFDMNPNPNKAEHSLTLDGASAAPHLKTVLATAEFYRLDDSAANAIIEEVRVIIRAWKEEAERLGFPATEIQRMDSVIQT